MRITGKCVKEWLAMCDFSKNHGMHYISWNGYHYILNGANEIIAAGKTPRECWREFTLYKAGYFLAMRELNK